MIGIIVIILFVIVALCQVFKSPVQNSTNAMKYGTINQRQAQLYQQYVVECRCLTDEDIQEAIKEAEDFEAMLKHKEIMTDLKIDPEYPYKNPHPAIVRRIAKYASMTGYERLLLAKRRFNKEGGYWDDRLNPFVPDGAPDEMYKRWVGSYKYYGGKE